jgi:predicted dehydrogenase
MSNRTGWGILGTGYMGKKFAEGLADVDGAVLQAVCSRSPDRAKAYGEHYDVPGRYADYDAMLDDERVDVVYVCSPHPHHAAQSVRALRAGKAVLCEKPLAMNAAEVWKACGSGCCPDTANSASCSKTARSVNRACSSRTSVSVWKGML